MSIITIVGAGMMGTALCWPLADNGHTIRLVGTHLDGAIIECLRNGEPHPTLQRQVPELVQPFDHHQIKTALEGAEAVVVGVNSLGINWFAETAGKHLEPRVPVLAVTKGLESQPNGDLAILPDVLRDKLYSAYQKQIQINAIGGPCIAHELAARRSTSVVFCGEDVGILHELRRLFSTPYYHIWLSTDLRGVEICAALKNAYAMGVALIVGMLDRTGPDGLAKMYNPQAAIFAQSCYEISKFLILSGCAPDAVGWLPGAGDLYVTVFGGRTLQLGRLLGQGVHYGEARQVLAGQTLESVEIISRVGRALPLLQARGLVQTVEFPLMRCLVQLIHDSCEVAIPWDQFFKGLAV